MPPTSGEVASKLCLLDGEGKLSTFSPSQPHSRQLSHRESLNFVDFRYAEIFILKPPTSGEVASKLCLLDGEGKLYTLFAYAKSNIFFSLFSLISYLYFAFSALAPISLLQ